MSALRRKMLTSLGLTVAACASGWGQARAEARAKVEARAAVVVNFMVGVVFVVVWK